MNNNTGETIAGFWYVASQIENVESVTLKQFLKGSSNLKIMVHIAIETCFYLL